MYSVLNILIKFTQNTFMDILDQAQISYSYLNDNNYTGCLCPSFYPEMTQ